MIASDYKIMFGDRFSQALIRSKTKLPSIIPINVTSLKDRQKILNKQEMFDMSL